MKAFLIRAAVVGAICVSSQIEAGTIKYPQKDPLIRISVPSGWSMMWDKDGSLNCLSPNHSKYVSVVPSENVNSKSALSAQLSRAARDAASNAKMKDAKLGATRESQSNGLSLMSIRAEGTIKGRAMAFTMVGFAPKKDNYFTLIALEPTPAKDKEISGIIGSISSVR